VVQKSVALRSAASRSVGPRTALAVVFLCMGAAGCATSPYRFPSPQPQPSPAPSAPAPQPSEPQPSEPQPNAASVALLERSRGERDEGRYAAAAASLERALRIDPNNPLLWIELAEVKAADGDRGQAQEMARKALTLAGNDRSIAERARRLL
jgi:tetratricopeptide (TPR) repeat protein